MRSQFDVVGIGSAIVDILSYVDESFLAERSIKKGNMTLLDKEQSRELYDALKPEKELSGGSAANTMAGIASFGGAPAFIGKTAEDKMGSVFSEALRSAGIYYATRPLKGDVGSANCLVLVTPDAERTMFTYLGASGSLSHSDMDDSVIKNSGIIYIEGYQWDLPSMKDVILKTCSLAKTSGKKIALSLSDSFVVERNRSELIHFMKTHVDLVFGNELEMLALFEDDNIENLVDKLPSLVNIGAITMGSKGSVVISNTEYFKTPASENVRVIDTTGAGDLFAAGFLFAMSRNGSLKECAALGNLAAGEIVSHLGARSEVSLKTLALQNDHQFNF